MSVPANKTAFVVLGMHGSGVPELAHCLSVFGYAPAEGLAPFNERILERFGGAWDKPGPFLAASMDLKASREAVASSIVKSDLEGASKHIASAYGGASQIVLGDPTVTPLVDLWDAALQHAGYEVRYVLTYRNPLSVSTQMRDRRGVAIHRALRLWLQYNVEALQLEKRSKLSCVLSYEELLENAPAAIAKTGAVPAEDAQEHTNRLAECLRSADLTRSPIGPEQSPLTAQALRRAYVLMQGWDDISDQDRVLEIDDLAKALSEAALLGGSFVWIPGGVIAKPAEPAVPKPAAPQPTGELSKDLRPRIHRPSAKRRLASPIGQRRVAIVHYHLFKNAGTSVDAILKENFADHWEEVEFTTEHGQTNVQGGVGQWLLDHPDALALSSHTAQLPVPKVEGLEILPIIFVRHPIDRLRSAYDFERRQNADTIGARLAKQHDFAGYLRARLANPQEGTCRNFQTARFAMAVQDESATLLARALQALEVLPFVGLVEAFDASMLKFDSLAAAHFRDFKSFTVRKNVTSEEGKPLSKKLDEIRADLGEVLFRQLEEANADDLELFSTLCARYGFAA